VVPLGALEHNSVSLAHVIYSNASTLVLAAIRFAAV
jgi:hypothetical protein